MEGKDEQKNEEGWIETGNIFVARENEYGEKRAEPLVMFLAERSTLNTDRE